MNPLSYSNNACGSGDGGLNSSLFQHNPERDCAPACNSFMIAAVRMDGAEDLEWQYRKDWTLSDFKHWRLIRDPLQEQRSYECRRQPDTSGNL